MMTDLLRSSLLALDAIEPAPGAWLIPGDALAALAKLPTGSVGAVFADPPYFLSNGGTTNSGGERVPVSKGAWDLSAGQAADHSFHRRWLRGVQRVLHPEGTAWVSGTHHCLFSVGWAMQQLGFHLLNTVTWEKPNPPPNLGCRTLTHSTEAIVWAAPERHEPLRHFFDYDHLRESNGGVQMKDVWRFTAPSSDEKEHGHHPAQKPLALLRRIVRASVRPGGIILDPFAGSATTGVAALVEGRMFIGIEADDAHRALAARRLSSVVPGVPNP